MPTDLEISRTVKLKTIKELIDQLGIDEEDFDYYGKYTGKIRLNVLKKMADKPNGKLILVTAMSPTIHSVLINAA